MPAVFFVRIRRVSFISSRPDAQSLTTIVLPVFQLAAPINLDGPYLITALFSKDADLKPLRELLFTRAAERWGNDRAAWPAQLRELDFMRAADCTGWPITTDTEGNFSVVMKSNRDFRPALVDQNAQPIYDPAHIVPGCMGRAEVAVWAYEKDGTAGVGISLLKLQIIGWSEEAGA